MLNYFLITNTVPRISPDLECWCLFFGGGGGGGRGGGVKGEIYLIFTERQWNLTLFYFILFFLAMTNSQNDRKCHDLM